MKTSAEAIVDDALALPAEARAFVAEQLIQSLDTDLDQPLSPAWRKEIQKRCREMDEGRVELREASEMLAQARAVLG